MAASDAFAKIRSRAAKMKASRDRDQLIQSIGELEYTQRTDSEASFDHDIAKLVEQVRHLDRMDELERRKSN